MLGHPLRRLLGLARDTKGKLNHEQCVLRDSPGTPSSVSVNWVAPSLSAVTKDNGETAEDMSFGDTFEDFKKLKMTLLEVTTEELLFIVKKEKKNQTCI